MAGDVRKSAKNSVLARRSSGRRPPAHQEEDAELGRLISGAAGPDRADRGAVLSMQRRAGNRATAQWLQAGRADGAEAPGSTGAAAAANGARVQRDLTKKVAAPKWTVGRPSSVKSIDRTVAQLVDQIAKMPGALDPIKALIGAVHKAIADFRGSKDATGKWATAVADLEGEVQAKESEIDAKIAVRQKGEARYANFTSLEPELAKYAKRDMFTASQFEADAEGPSIRTALAGTRGPGGELTKGAMDEMTAAQAGDIEKEKTGGKDITFAGLSVDQVRSFMNAHTNALTGKTMYPELGNITDPNANKDAVVTTAIDVGGVTMQVEHNASDVNFADRLKLLKDAVAKVAAAGIKLPPLKVHLPKYGRSLKLKATDSAAKIDCEIPEKSSRAVFVPPDFMHLSSEVIGTPDLGKVKNPTTGAEEYKFSSTGWDPSGVASIVHEFGHVIHFVTAPGKYHGLWGASFTGKTSSGKQSSQVANAEVSQYGGKPREFVAEVFLGLVYGKEYSVDVMEMYRAFGGPIPPAASAKAAKKAL